MVRYIPPPDPRSLLPPLLACLPTASVSPRPPPALLPLLSPILCQRVQLLATASDSSTDSWLPLLCWESGSAKKLVDIVSNSDAFELHPVSGEIDFGEVDSIKYRRVDEETLQARLTLRDLELVIILLWCEEDEGGAGASQWRVAEVRPVDDVADSASDEWWPTMTQADEKAHEKMVNNALEDGEDSFTTGGKDTKKSGDDDDYWARYDSTPGMTPAAEPSPGPAPGLQGRTRSTSEAEYYARYAQVQPEMDNDNPSENKQAIGESTLNGDIMTSPSRPLGLQTQHDPLAPGIRTFEEDNLNLNQPTATSSSTPTTVPRLESSADAQSVAEVAVQQHVSTSIKSLFRLCRGAGIEREEFDDMVRRELETLSLMSED